jgi:hypothetical protein
MNPAQIPDNAHLSCDVFVECLKTDCFTAVHIASLNNQRPTNKEYFCAQGITVDVMQTLCVLQEGEELMVELEQMRKELLTAGKSETAL